MFLDASVWHREGVGYLLSHVLSSDGRVSLVLYLFWKGIGCIGGRVSRGVGYLGLNVSRDTVPRG